MKLKIAISAVLIGIALCASLAFYGWHQHEAKQHVREKTKEITIHLSKAMADAQGDSNMTFMEFFSASNQAIKSIDEAVFVIKREAPAGESNIHGAAIEYADDSQQLIRSLQSFLRQQLNFNSTQDAAKKYLARLKALNAAENEYQYDSLMKSANESIAEMEKASMEMAAIKEDLISKIDALSESASRSSLALGADVLIGSETIAIARDHAEKL